MHSKIKCFIGILIIFLLLFTWINIQDQKNIAPNIHEASAQVIEVDNSEIMVSNVSAIGYQALVVKVLSGTLKGEEIEVDNSLNGQVEYDQVYRKGDMITVAIRANNDGSYDARAMDYYRQGWLLVIFIVFVTCIILYAGVIGFKAILSFGLSFLILWKFLLTGLLAGKDPILLTGITIIILSAIIIFLVSGFNKRGMAAFLATTGGLMVTLIITHFFGYEMNLNGLTQPYAQTLLISGYGHLNLKEIFYSAIILGASGAAMDIAVDISASMHEIKEKKPEIELKELIKSGFTVGQQVIGTMATTLLLAYSGSYLTLLMLFIAKNTTTTRMLNLKVVSSEIMRTLIGSTGLVIVAPLTALIAGFLLTYDFSLKGILEKSKTVLSSRF